MSRPTRVPYHQNVYDLLDLAGGECPDALRLIDAHEAAHGPLPASVREWLLVPNATSLLREYSNSDRPQAVGQLLTSYAADDTFVYLLDENQSVCSYHIRRGPSDDPPVWIDAENSEEPDEYQELSPMFSQFLWSWFRYFHFMRNGPLNFQYGRPSDPHAGVAWACTPAAPFDPVLLDVLAEKADDHELRSLPGGAIQHRFAFGQAAIRVTADPPGWPAPHAAWWAEAPTDAALAALLGRFADFGILAGPAVRRPATDENDDPFAGP